MDPRANQAAQLIRTARERSWLPLDELATRVGLSPTELADYELGAREPSLSMLDRLVAATGSQLEVKLASRRGAGSPTMTPAERSAAVIDVLLLADAVPRREPAERQPNWPRMDSTSRRG